MNVYEIYFFSKNIIHIHKYIRKHTESSYNDNKSSMSQKKGSCIFSAPQSF